MGKILKYLMAINVMAVLSALIVKQLVRSEGDETTDEFTLATVMFGNQFNSSSTALRSGSLITYMGGVELDLTNSTLATGARLTLLTVMGGVDVRVPPHWRIEADTQAMLGDSQIQLDEQDALSDSAPVLRIEARTIMGGLRITNRPRRHAAPTP